MSQELERSAAAVISDLTPGGQQCQAVAPFVPIIQVTLNHGAPTLNCPPPPQQDRDCSLVDAQQDAAITTHNGENNNIKKEKKENSIVASLLAGAMAGAIAKTTIAPLDRTKINFQTNNKRYTYTEAGRFLVNSYKQSGFLSLWRGNSATMARIVPYSATQFAAHEQWKKVFGLTDSNTHHTIKRFMAGSLAGMTSQFLTYPLDLARARMAVTPRDTYKSLSQMFVVMLRRDGFFSMYRGLCPTMLGVMPYAGTSFGIFETLKARRLEELPEGTQIGSMEKLYFGALAGAVGQSSSYPLDIVRRRMQTASINGNCSDYNTVLGTLLKIYREEGIARGLYKGVTMNWLKGPIAAGISFSLYDYFKLTLQEGLAPTADDD